MSKSFKVNGRRHFQTEVKTHFITEKLITDIMVTASRLSINIRKIILNCYYN